MLTQILSKAETSDSWEIFVDEAVKYHKTADGGLKRREVFSAEILFNIYAMSMEKYLMGFSIYFKDLPYNHTFRDFAETISRITGNSELDSQLKDDLEFMDSFQEICSVDDYERKEPSENEIKKIGEICNRIKEFVFKEIHIN